MPINSCKRFNRPALTLVEVITSIALLSTLLVGMLTAYSRHVRQISRAANLQTAVELTDDLLANWYRETRPISEYKAGLFESDPTFFWRLIPKQPGAERQAGGQVLRLETRRTEQPSSQPVLVVELLDSIPDVQSQNGGIEP